MARRQMAATLLGLATPLARTRPAQAQTSAAEVIALIEDAARRHGVDSGRAIGIARCESWYGTHWRINAPGNPCRGVYQWDRPSWEEAAPKAGIDPSWDAALDPASNVEVSIAAMARGEWWRWTACL